MVLKKRHSEKLKEIYYNTEHYTLNEPFPEGTHQIKLVYDVSKSSEPKVDNVKEIWVFVGYGSKANHYCEKDKSKLTKMVAWFCDDRNRLIFGE